MKKLLLFAILISFLFPIFACTTAIISGKATSDGRPLLWKHRDSDFYNNKILYFKGVKYNFVGLTDSESERDGQVWGGFNKVGFAIMNNASYNLKPATDSTKIADLEGFFMKNALENCASVAEFETWLTSQPKPLGVEANFGVIDANGGAAYFEVNNFEYTKFDVNDPAIAPEGYLIRTNYSFSGEKNKGAGYVRYITAEKLFKGANITPRFLLQDASRCLRNELTKTDLIQVAENINNEQVFYPISDNIVREYSTSALVVQGVKPDEDPVFTTGYVLLGLPLTSIAVPFWINPESGLPKTITGRNNEHAPVCNWSLDLKKKIFALDWPENERYVNLSAIWNKNQTGIWQQIQKQENPLLLKTFENLEKWRISGMKTQEISNFYNWYDLQVSTIMSTLLNN